MESSSSSPILTHLTTELLAAMCVWWINNNYYWIIIHEIVSRCEHRAAVCFAKNRAGPKPEEDKNWQIGKVWPALFFCPEIETAAATAAEWENQSEWENRACDESNRFWLIEVGGRAWSIFLLRIKSDRRQHQDWFQAITHTKSMSLVDFSSGMLWNNFPQSLFSRQMVRNCTVIVNCN